LMMMPNGGLKPAATRLRPYGAARDAESCPLERGSESAIR
jgi:hypothetical protein